MGPILFCSSLFCHCQNVTTEFPTCRHTFTALLLTPEAGEKVWFFHMTGPFLAGGDPFTTGRARTLAPGTVQPTRRDRDRLVSPQLQKPSRGRERPAAGGSHRRPSPRPRPPTPEAARSSVRGGG